jgi:aminoglycoside/choline kinase family phosphotransferase
VTAALDVIRRGSPSLQELAPFPEETLLGTGGALWNARDFLAQDEVFLLHNGDVWSEEPLGSLLDAHARHSPLATLLLCDHPAVNSVLVDEDGIVRDVGGRLGATPGPGGRCLTYTGIAVIDRRLLSLLPAGPSSLADCFLNAAGTKPGGIRGLTTTSPWSDLGTLAAYLDAHGTLLRRDRGRRTGPAQGDPPALHQEPGASVAPSAELRGFVCLGRDASVGAGARLEECVLLDRAAVAPSSRLRRAVVGPGWLVCEAPGGRRLCPLAAEGSGRRFWRLYGEDRGAILMVTPEDDPDRERWLAIGRFLAAEELGAPALIAAETAMLSTEDPRRQVLMEDLGERTLHAITEPPARTGADLRIAYEAALSLLVDLQVRGTARRTRCPLLRDRRHGYGALRWESDYCRRFFLEEHLHLEVPAGLEGELHALATALLAQPEVLMHRDFQSRNILLKEGRARLVDFQAMRSGPLAYDLASLLLDPYVELEPDLRQELQEYYRQELARRGGPGLDSQRLHGWFLAAGVQRLLQTLGAFAYLCGRGGRPGFRADIEPALCHLQAALASLRSHDSPPGPLPHLERIIARACGKLAGPDRGRAAGRADVSGPEETDNDIPS